MSKKTNAAKLALATTPRHPRKRTRGKRPNPANVQRDSRSFIDKMPGPLKDPVFLHHVTRAMLRYLELEYPVELQIQRTVDAEFPPGEIDTKNAPVQACKYCGKSITAAYEESLGMYCHTSPTALHVMETIQVPERPE